MIKIRAAEEHFLVGQKDCSVGKFVRTIYLHLGPDRIMQLMNFPNSKKILQYFTHGTNFNVRQIHFRLLLSSPPLLLVTIFRTVSTAWNLRLRRAEAWRRCSAWPWRGRAGRGYSPLVRGGRVSPPSLPLTCSVPPSSCSGG